MRLPALSGVLEYSMSKFAVSEEKERELLKRMSDAGLREEDIEEKFVRSSGHGGQNVNKTATCVWLKHLPTGAEVKCMKDRSQSINRFLARRLLLEKIEELRGIKGPERKKLDKKVKQKARRTRKSKSKYAGVIG